MNELISTELALIEHLRDNPTEAQINAIKVEFWQILRGHRWGSRDGLLSIRRALFDAILEEK